MNNIIFIPNANGEIIMSYQIFISYRRTCEPWLAELYKDFLSANGWKVFLDKDSIGAGYWKEHIMKALSEATDFLVVIAPGSLNHCTESPDDPDDYFRLEIEYAVRHNKNIIPIMWKDLDRSSAFNNKLPILVQQIFDHNGISDAGNTEKMRINYNKLISILQSKPKLYQKSITSEGKYAFSLEDNAYNPMEPHERKRIHLQARYSEELDKQCFRYAKKVLGKTRGLRALDIGCSDGFVTFQRLSTQNGFCQTIGVDINDMAIREANKAKGKIKNDIYSFYTIDVESDDFEKKMRSIMDIEQIECFDIIYFAFSLHQLGDPVKVLRRVNYLLSPHGVIIARGVDDEAQIGYAVHEDGTVDEQTSSLVQENIELSYHTKGIGRRFFGRQFYSWMALAGYSDIVYKYSIIDNLNMTPEEREDLFDYFFSFRKDFTERLFLQDEQNQEYALQHKKMLKNLSNLKNNLINNELFYYMLTSFAAVAKRYDIDS